MSTLATLRQTLVETASITQDEGFLNSRLESLISNAIIQHNKNYTISSLPDQEVEPVITLAWAAVCYKRAAKVVSESNQSGANGFSQDRETPYKKNIDLAHQLEERYNLLVSALGLTVGGSREIAVGTLMHKESLFDSTVPIILAHNTGVITARVTELSTHTDLLIDWTVTQWDGNYYDIFVFNSIDPINSMIQLWNYQSDQGIPGLANGLTRLVTITDPAVTEVKLQNVTRAGTTNRFLLVAKNRSLKYTFSNELILVPYP